MKLRAAAVAIVFLAGLAIGTISLRHELPQGTTCNDAQRYFDAYTGKAQQDVIVLGSDNGKVLAWKAVYIHTHEVPRILEPYLDAVYAMTSPAIPKDSLTLDDILQDSPQLLELVMAEGDALRTSCPGSAFLNDLWR